MIPVGQLQDEAKRQSEAQFVAAHPDPAFLVFPGAENTAEANVMGETTRWRRESASNGANWLSKTFHDGDELPLPDRLRLALTPMPGLDLSEQSGATHVVFVHKDPEHPSPFPNMVTVGRMTSNDLRFASSRVSKLHACILRDEPSRGWALLDQSSTNGTWVDGVRLPLGRKTPLQDGSWVSLGAAIGLKFLLPDSLYGFLRGSEQLRQELDA